MNVCVYVCRYDCVFIQYLPGGQSAICRKGVSPPTSLLPRVDPRSLGSVAPPSLLHLFTACGFVLFCF